MLKYSPEIQNVKRKGKKKNVTKEKKHFKVLETEKQHPLGLIVQSKRWQPGHVLLGVKGLQVPRLQQQGSLFETRGCSRGLANSKIKDEIKNVGEYTCWSAQS